MAVLTVPDEGLRIENPAEIANFVERFGLWYERWDLAKLPAKNASQEEILSRYKEEIERLNKRGGYVTADVINVSPATPGLDAMLEKFSPEHTHSEDEVRFVVHGRGVFHINPVNGPIFAIEMESGDLINVPAGTQHWFNLCAEKSIVTIRLFQETSGWAPHYVSDSKHKQYQPLCFGPKPLSMPDSASTK
ncbi:MAG TPA: cupin domain-containing protein [Drouetiella sp.]